MPIFIEKLLRRHFMGASYRKFIELVEKYLHFYINFAIFCRDKLTFRSFMKGVSKTFRKTHWNKSSHVQNEVWFFE